MSIKSLSCTEFQLPSDRHRELNDFTTDEKADRFERFLPLFNAVFIEFTETARSIPAIDLSDLQAKILDDIMNEAQTILIDEVPPDYYDAFKEKQLSHCDAALLLSIAKVHLVRFKQKYKRYFKESDETLWVTR